ncbi:hypothetical protein [Labrenzia sp. THAF82]|uniref:hypothetical protein n=1 Tax=Labrenzia sp. THAF82 TaxID=2587861 RepID=UPI001268BDB7|nr:hypothetical protein [Labrenzia sp. THAF82]
MERELAILRQEVLDFKENRTQSFSKPADPAERSTMEPEALGGIPLAEIVQEERNEPDFSSDDRNLFRVIELCGDKDKLPHIENKEKFKKFIKDTLVNRKKPINTDGVMGREIADILRDQDSDIRSLSVAIGRSSKLFEILQYKRDAGSL